MNNDFFDRYAAMLLCANGRKINDCSSERVKKAAEKQLEIARQALMANGLFEKAETISLEDFREYPTAEQAVDYFESNGLNDFIGEVRPADA